MQPTPDIPPPTKPVVIEDERCLPWSISAARDTAVSVTRLKVPSKARSEFEKACDANSKSKFDEAEKHVRAAIDKFPGYAAAWVLLGVLQEEQRKREDAQNTCSHAATVDSKYAPAYLCQAELATRSGQWDQVLNLAGTALGLNSAADGYVYYYRATALYHTGNLPEAQKSALQAQEIDVDRKNVPLSFLIAQIYEAQGQRSEAQAQLQQLLKRHLDRGQEDAAKQYLASLESEAETK